jgi:hypothetical protein
MVGATRTITYDLPRTILETPKSGDYLRSISRVDQRTLSVYLILRVREVRRRQPHKDRRFKLVVQAGYSASEETRGWWMYWSARRKRGG